MNNVEFLRQVTTNISDSVWPIFLPFFVVISLYISFCTFSKFNIKSKKDTRVSFKDIVGPASLSLGAKVGTGSLIGVLGSLNKLSVKGQGVVEGMVLWGIIGALILIPLTYSETFIARLKNISPVGYIKSTMSSQMQYCYGVSLVVLYVFGFGGFQFNGIDAVITISTGHLANYNMNELQRYIFIVIPLIIMVGLLVISKSQNLFIDTITSLIGFAIFAYLGLFVFFVINTLTYVPLYLDRVIDGFFQPVSMGIGVPAGMVFSLQRVIQTSEAGLGTSALASEEGKALGPHESSVAQAIPTAITVLLSLVVTSYITSYGISNKMMFLPSEGMERLYGFFRTVEHITGYVGLIVMTIFALLSGATTLLGSYFFFSHLFGGLNTNLLIVLYLIMISLAGTLAVFGFDLIFDVVDILLFLVSGINVLALVIYIHNLGGNDL
ncbi:hypothetical protein K5X82_16915 [Halosquirtibacter xylanolyticus]|uniref:alanine:cation symporter family protein n=1 Tax=Halosquirtibacter xylanolyticus TaxID=3374599 RepID=UPI0037478C7C|nr:hypothetical protein K5X82_16915 [Prolixibacteraceae bacterium]